MGLSQHPQKTACVSSCSLVGLYSLSVQQFCLNHQLCFVEVNSVVLFLYKGG